MQTGNLNLLIRKEGTYLKSGGLRGVWKAPNPEWSLLNVEVKGVKISSQGFLGFY